MIVLIPVVRTRTTISRTTTFMGYDDRYLVRIMYSQA